MLQTLISSYTDNVETGDSFDYLLTFLKQTFDSAVDPIFIKDNECRIVFGNQAFLNLYSENLHDKIIGYTTVENFVPEQADLFLANDRYALEHGYHRTLETVDVPSGKTVILDTQKSRFYSPDGEKFILGIAHDVTNKEQLIKTLTQARYESDQFAYICSHDLQEPMRMIGSFSSKLSERITELGITDTSILKYANFLKENAERGQDLIRDILEYTRIDNNNSKNILIDLNETLEIIKSTIVYNQPNVEIHYKQLPTIYGQKTQIYQLFLNLISNGIKYAKPAVAPVVTISHETKNNEDLFCVSDNGIGIAEKNQSKIFEVFKRLHHRSEYPGTGIGLSLCKKIVDNHKGKIWVESELNEGSSFYISLPNHSKA